MKAQFTSTSLLLAIAFVAICLGGTQPLVNRLRPMEWEVIGVVYLYGSATWVPFAFLIYSIGRRV